jgi:hypothetical protein
MFVGHLAVGLAAARVPPRIGLGWLIAAPIALDLVWPLFVLAGLEQVSITPGATAFTPLTFVSYPWSHSLVMALVWGAAFAALARWRGVTGTGASGLLVALVASHWVLDMISHAPDMPLWPGSSPRYGLGLWDSIPATVIVEGAMWATAIGMYLHVRPLQTRGARLAFWSFVGVTTVLWIAGPWSPPPPSSAALAGFALVAWLLIPWAARVEGRQPRRRDA